MSQCGGRAPREGSGATEGRPGQRQARGEIHAQGEADTVYVQTKHLNWQYLYQGT